MGNILSELQRHFPKQGDEGTEPWLGGYDRSLSLVQIPAVDTRTPINSIKSEIITKKLIWFVDKRIRTLDCRCRKWPLYQLYHPDAIICRMEHLFGGIMQILPTSTTYLKIMFRSIRCRVTTKAKFVCFFKKHLSSLRKIVFALQFIFTISRKIGLLILSFPRRSSLSIRVLILNIDLNFCRLLFSSLTKQSRFDWQSMELFSRRRWRLV